MLPPRPLNDRSVMRSWNIFIPVNRAGVFISAQSTEIPVAATEISVDRAGPVLIWTHRNFYKGNSGRTRSRLTGPTRSTGLILTGPNSVHGRFHLESCTIWELGFAEKLEVKLYLENGRRKVCSGSPAVSGLFLTLCSSCVFAADAGSRSL